MRCPRCGGFDVRATGQPGEVPGVEWFRCASNIITMVRDSAAPTPDGMRPHYSVCDHEYLGPSSSAAPLSATLCECGRIAAGACRWCSKTLCEVHLEVRDNKVVCAGCGSPEGIALRLRDAEVQRQTKVAAEDAAAARRAMDELTRRQAEEERLERDRMERERREQLAALPFMGVRDLVRLMQGSTAIHSELGITHADAMRIPTLTRPMVVEVIKAAGYGSHKVKAGWSSSGKATDRRVWLVGVEPRVYTKYDQPHVVPEWVALTDGGECVYVSRSVNGRRRSPIWKPGMLPLWRPSPHDLRRIPAFQGLLRALPPPPYNP